MVVMKLMVDDKTNISLLLLFVADKKLAKTVRHRPQIGFLEAVPYMGTVAPIVSPSEQKARAAFEKQRPAASV